MRRFYSTLRTVKRYQAKKKYLQSHWRIYFRSSKSNWKTVTSPLKTKVNVSFAGVGDADDAHWFPR